MKKITCLLAGALLLLALVLPAGAAEASLGYVTDAARLLTDSQQRTLEDTARRISEENACGVYIITLDDYRDYAPSDSIYEAAKGLYRKYGLGWGQEKSGVLLLLSMADRDYTLIAYGYGNTAFTDYGKDTLADTFLDNLGDNDWYGGFTDYLNKSESMLKSARAGRPLDVDSSPPVVFLGAALSVILGCGVGLIICCVLRAKMKSTGEKTGARDYLRQDSLVFTRREDLFTHATQTRVKIEKRSGSGGTTVDSGGFSGKSGKF